VQEAVINALKHARAELISLSLDIRDDSVFVVIRDDGRGFDLKKIKGSGIGLASMRERANLIDAKIDVTSQPEIGTTITLQVPLEKNRQREKMLS
jgi:two-component system sensor histidine kinase DegS